MEQQFDDYKMLRKHAEAIVFYLEHPEAINDDITKAYIEKIKKLLAKGQKQLKVSEA